MERAAARDPHDHERLWRGQEDSRAARAGRGACRRGGHRERSRSTDDPQIPAV